MDLERIEKKLREARFFLDKMKDQESRASGDREPFDFFLSACLGAARTVDYRLRHEQPTPYPAWRKIWDANLTTPEQRLIEFLVIDRNVEVHKSGASRSVKTEEIKIVGHNYSDKSGNSYVSGPPGMPPAIIFKSGYFFTINGIEMACDRARRGLRLQVFEPATPRFKDRLQFTKRGGVACQRNRGIEVVDAVMLHSKRQDVAKRTGEESGVAVAAFLVRRMMWRPAQEKGDVASADMAGQPPDEGHVG